MKKLLFILLLLPFLSKGQTVGQFRYDTAKFYKQGGVTVLKVEGAIQVGQNPTYTTTSSASAIGQSFTLGTISSDQTITFPSLEPGRAGTFIFVDNINNSAFAWNVVGPVLERTPSGSFPISVLPTGLHIFRWDGTNWNRLGSGGGASDSTQYTSPIAVDYDNPDYRRVYLDFPAFPQDTIGVVIHNDSLFNIHYPFDGPRDSSFIVDLSTIGGGTNIYNSDGQLTGTRTVDVNNYNLNIVNTAISPTVTTLTVTSNDIQDAITGLASAFGTGVYGRSGSGLGVLGSSAGAFSTSYGGTFRNTRNSSSAVMAALSVERDYTGTPSDGIGVMQDFNIDTYGSIQGPNLSNRFTSVWTTADYNTRTSDFSISGYSAGTLNTLFGLSGSGAARLPKYGVGTFSGTAAYQLGIDASGNIIETTGGGDVSLSFDSVGVGEASLISENDVLRTRLFKNTYALAWDTATDRSIRATIDTTLMATRAYALSVGGGGGGGTPGGSNTQIQFNNSGVFGGDAGFTYNSTTNELTVDSANVLNIRGAFAGGTYPYNYHIDDTLRLRALRITNAVLTTTGKAALIALRTDNTSSASHALEIINPSNASLFRVSNAGEVSNDNFSFNGSILTWSSAAPQYRSTNTAGTASISHQFQHTNIVTATSGIQRVVQANGTFAPTSGTAQYAAFQAAQTINQTGSASGVTFGFYSAPILTSAVDYNAFYSTTTKNQFGLFRINDANTTTTTDATTTTIYTASLSATDAESEYDITIRVNDASGNVGIYKRLLRAKNSGGTVTILGSFETIGTDYEDAAVSACSISATVSGTNILFQATGIAATTLTWRPVLSYKVFVE